MSSQTTLLSIAQRDTVTGKVKSAKVSSYFVGQEMYAVFVDENTGTCELETWIVRSIRKGVVSVVQRNRFTWVKLSKKQGDFGWAKYIPSYYRRAWTTEHGHVATCHDEMATTAKGAWRAVIKLAASGRLYIDNETVVAKAVATARRMAKKGRKS